MLNQLKVAYIALDANNIPRATCLEADSQIVAVEATDRPIVAVEATDCQIVAAPKVLDAFDLLKLWRRRRKQFITLYFIFIHKD